MNELINLPSIAIAFVVTIGFMGALRPVAQALGLVDTPGGRKDHVGDVPLTGGMAMFVGMFAGLMLVDGAVYSLPTIFVASSILLVVGLIDDRFHIASPVRFTAQIAVVLIMVYGANLPLANIGDPFGNGEIVMGRFTLIFTMLVALTMINAYNLIDGSDGLAGSLGLIALLAVAAVAGVGHMAGATALTISAAVVGYLMFNFPASWNRKARAFMGDGGSTLLGFTIVWITIGISQGPERLISPVHCLWFASIPIYDTLSCFAVRISQGKSPLTPGRDHFHHVLKSGGFGIHATLGILVGLQATYALIGLGAHFAGVPDVVMFTGWSLLGLSQRVVIRTIATLYRRTRRLHTQVE